MYCLLHIYDVMCCLLHKHEIDYFTDAKLSLIINMDLSIRYAFISSTAVVRLWFTTVVSLPFTAAICVSCQQQPCLSRLSVARLDQKQHNSSSSRTSRPAAIRLANSCSASRPAAERLVAHHSSTSTAAVCPSPALKLPIEAASRCNVSNSL